MREIDIQREIYQMLRYRYKLWPDHFPDIPGAKKQKGRPDLVVMNPRSAGFYVEVKTLNVKRESSLAFSKINEGQRRWLSEWNDQRVLGSWLGLGTVGHRPRELYMIPWTFWLQIEKQVSQYQDSLPYQVGKGYLLDMQSLQLDFRMLEDYRCYRVPPKFRMDGESGWRMPDELEEVWVV
jgi:hypothetical protein